MKPYTETIPGTNVKFEMTPIPDGTFLMGSTSSEPGRLPDEGPQHPVTLRAFWMGKTEVTWDEYDVFAFHVGIRKPGAALVRPPMDAEKIADAVTRPTPPYADETFGYGRHGFPVISITHHAAMEYTRWLSALTEKDYRLPTEAEWEYACRAGTQTAFGFGDDAGKLGEHGWYSQAGPHPVGQKKPNPWGLEDMNGNVAEWVLDLYDKNAYSPYDPRAPVLSPVLLPTADEYPYGVRGGSWVDKPASLRCAARQASTPDWSERDPQLPQSIWWHTDATFVGFRVVRPLVEQENLRGLRSKVKKY